MVGTLIKTETNDGHFVGLVKNYFYRDYTEEIVIGVIWNDCDDTQETFNPYEGEYDTCLYYYHDKGRWWQVDENFYKFKELLEGKCK